ncbi:unnamed protein product [Fructobacillus fructosus]|nr:hypothetical protein [Fructobacillus fructosus]CAK1249917.1 unnamed protein product [Fructobacillus fructosus]
MKKWQVQVLNDHELLTISGGMIWRPTNHTTAKDRRDFIEGFFNKLF